MMPMDKLPNYSVLMNHLRMYKTTLYISIHALNCLSLHRMANKCLLKVAQIAADLEMYEEAIEKFERVAASAVDDPLLKWSVKEYFLKAGLCHLCTEVGCNGMVTFN